MFLALCAGVLAVSACAMAAREVYVPSSTEIFPAPAPAAPAIDGNGSSCSNTYVEDERVASLLEGSCEWNTYMCCWTGNDGPGGMTNNSDVCRVLDYPQEGDVLELPRDSEGPVYCHGFGWPNGSDASSYIRPLYQHVANFNRTEEGGFYGNMTGAPECGCIEDMPVVDNAACSRHSDDGIVPCEVDLWMHYRRIGEPNGPMESNLVRACDNKDVPNHDYRACEHNTYLCCWTENDGLGMIDNTDVCRAGGTEYPGESEGEVHCHGFVWPQNATDGYIHLLAQFVQTFAHTNNRGYYGNIPGSLMCGCVEEMAEITEADCTTYNETKGGTFMGCTRNDLRTRFTELYPDGVIANLVEECDNA